MSSEVIFTMKIVRSIVAVLAIALGLSSHSRAQTENFPYIFTGNADGADPSSNLIADSAGNLYGTTYNGGMFGGKYCYSQGCGVVFELSPTSGGGWTESVLYTFTGGSDGGYPLGGVVFDASGNLYGTAYYGGANTSFDCQDGQGGCGVAFKLSPGSGGVWSETVLYTFPGSVAGANPRSNLAIDAAGNVYGATQLGGHGNFGTIYELSPDGSGGWTHQILHNFSGGTDGFFPFGGVTLDTAGNLYATATQGGDKTNCKLTSGCGTVIKLLPNGKGGFNSHVAYSFTGGGDGGVPMGGVLVDGAGNLYGATLFGGTKAGACNQQFVAGCGVVYELLPKVLGNYRLKVLYQFQAVNSAAAPASTLTFDSQGNLYGTGQGTETSCCGFVFELSPSSSGSWTENTLHIFAGGTDGWEPGSNGVYVDASGNVYGSATGGGMAGGCPTEGETGCGVIYEFTPQ